VCEVAYVEKVANQSVVPAPTPPALGVCVARLSRSRASSPGRPAPRDTLRFAPRHVSAPCTRQTDRTCVASDRWSVHGVPSPVRHTTDDIFVFLRRARASPIKGRHPYLAHLSTSGLPRLAPPPAVSSAPPPNHSPMRDRRCASKPPPSLARTQHPRPACRPTRAAHSPERVLQWPAHRASVEPPRRLLSGTFRARKLSPGDLQAIPRPRPADPAAGVRRISATRAAGHGQGPHCKVCDLSKVLNAKQGYIREN
jgi:hypothetical protein